jgi:hypothetical protein
MSAPGLLFRRSSEKHLSGLEISDDFLADFYANGGGTKPEHTNGRSRLGLATLAALATQGAGEMSLGQQRAKKAGGVVLQDRHGLTFHGPQRQGPSRGHFECLLESAKKPGLGQRLG